MHAKRILYLNIHVIQVVPPSCVNRDDAGSPKTCYYGRALRARVSSQSWKRAIRMYLREFFGDTGVRTKKIAAMLAKRLSEETGCAPKDAVLFVKKCLSAAGVISDKDDAKDAQAFFSRDQIDGMAEAVCRYYRENCMPAAEAQDNSAAKKKEKKSAPVEFSKEFKKELCAAAKERPAVSQLLCGRMFASNQELGYDAACQVAHAISVDEVREEVDYFTAVGDNDTIRDVYGIEEEHAGSDYIDSKYYTSGTLYRYADVNLSEGTELDAVDAAKAAVGFLEAFVMSMPTGSANSYANMTVPETVVVELRDERPISYAPAFLKPVRGSEEMSVAEAAEEKLYKYMDKIDRKYGAPIARWELGKVSMKEMYRQVQEEINNRRG